MSSNVILMVDGAPGTTPKSLEKNLKRAGTTVSIKLLQKAAFLFRLQFFGHARRTDIQARSSQDFAPLTIGNVSHVPHTDRHRRCFDAIRDHAYERKKHIHAPHAWTGKPRDAGN